MGGPGATGGGLSQDSAWQGPSLPRRVCVPCGGDAVGPRGRGGDHPSGAAVADSRDVQSRRKGSQGDTIKVTAPLSEEELESGPADVYILDRQTLHLLEYSYINKDGEPLITGEFQYGIGDKGLTDKYISAWDKTRRINFEYEKITGSGEPEYETLSILVPATWEVVPVYEETTYLYMDRELTKPYKYPGDGKEYTVYVTNAAG